MPELRDPAAIRAILETDRTWSVYALGDLAPGFFEHCVWHGGAASNSIIDSSALVLLYAAFSTPVLFTLGEPARVAPILEEIGGVREMYLQIRPEILPLLAARYRISRLKEMWRMRLEPAAFLPAPVGDEVRLGPPDAAAVERLYADGSEFEESPDFFSASMIADGVFYGVRDGDELAAVAGTHLVAPGESVAAIGNVYTRRDRRGRGLAARLTSAVTRELLRLDISTIALNVHQPNAAAIRVYRRLGFVPYCDFREGVASLAGPQNLSI